MQRTICSAILVILPTIATTVSSSGVGVLNAAGRANPAQAKMTTPNAGDACSLLTKENAAAALGEAVKGPQSSAGRSVDAGRASSSCEYTASGLHKVQLILRHMSPDTAAVYKALCAKKGKEGLSGLGDVSCWYNGKHEELQVLKGETFFSIMMQRSGDPTEAIKGVAKSVFEQLR